MQYLAVSDGAAEFRLRFTVESRGSPLEVCVFTEGYTLQAEATLLEPGARGRPLSSAAVNQIDLGLVSHPPRTCQSSTSDWSVIDLGLVSHGTGSETGSGVQPQADERPTH